MYLGKINCEHLKFSLFIHLSLIWDPGGGRVG